MDIPFHSDQLRDQLTIIIFWFWIIIFTLNFIFLATYAPDTWRPLRQKRGKSRDRKKLSPITWPTNAVMWWAPTRLYAYSLSIIHYLLLTPFQDTTVISFQTEFFRTPCGPYPYTLLLPSILFPIFPFHFRF